MASSASGHDALQDYIENHSYLMRPKKPLPQPVKSDPFLESFERWNQSMKVQTAMEKKLREMTDLDRLLHEASKAQGQTSADPAPQSVEANSHQPPVIAKTDEPVCWDGAATMSSHHRSNGVWNCSRQCSRHCWAYNIAECARPTSEAQPVQSGAAKTEAAPESKGVGYVEPQWSQEEYVEPHWSKEEYVEPHWSQEEWRTWLRSSGFASRRAYERQVRHKFRKPSTKWRTYWTKQCCPHCTPKELLQISHSGLILGEYNSKYFWKHWVIWWIFSFSSFNAEYLKNMFCC